MRLTYANVMSSIAVFLALGGVAWAATALPRNSVGPAQLKAGAVTSGKLDNGGLAAADFARGALRGASGAPGPAGAPGQRGPVGDPGAQGETGDTCADLRCSSSDVDGYVELTTDADIKLADALAFKVLCEDKTCRLLLAGTPAGMDSLRAWAAEVPAPARRSVRANVLTPNGERILAYHLTDAYPATVVRFGDRVQVTLETVFLQRISV